MEVNSYKEDLHIEQFLSESCFEKKYLTHGFFKWNFYLPINNKSTDCMAAKWVLECAASVFPLSPRRIPKMEKIGHKSSVKHNLENVCDPLNKRHWAGL